MSHLFTIDDNVWDSVDTQTVLDTAEALNEVGLFKFPFPQFDVQVFLNEKAVRKYFTKQIQHKIDAPMKTLTFRFFMDFEKNQYTYEVKAKDKFLSTTDIYAKAGFDGHSFEKTTRIKSGLDYLSNATVTFLIVLLATKNADKVTEHIKKHGPKSRKRPREYDYITTIKIGKITETMRSDSDGHGSVRPHLRRGHIRNQRVGKDLAEIKPIFIHPVFVNADEGWINNQRKEYRLVA